MINDVIISLAGEGHIVATPLRAAQLVILDCLMFITAQWLSVSISYLHCIVKSHLVLYLLSVPTVVESVHCVTGLFNGVLQPMLGNSFCCLQLLQWLARYLLNICAPNVIGLQSLTYINVCLCYYYQWGRRLCSHLSLSVHLSVCQQHNSNSYRWFGILTKIWTSAWEWEFWALCPQVQSHWGLILYVCYGSSHSLMWSY